MITVRELIEVAGMDTTAVLAGEAFLDKELRGVTSFDSPDGHRWLRPGEFVLTTGFPFVAQGRETASGLIQLIDALAERGTTGFAIKLGRYVDALPEAVIARAIDRQMPVLSFPMEKGWSDVIVPVTSYINAKQRQELDRTHAIYERFHRHLTSGGGVENLAELLHRVLERPVSIYLRTPRKRLDVPATVTHAPPLEKLLGRTGPNVSTREPLTRYRDRHLIRWLLHHGETQGAILLWEVERDLHPWEKVAIEQTAALLSLEIERHQTVAAACQRFRNDFLHLLVAGCDGSRDLLYRKAEEAGWSLADHYAAAVLSDAGAPDIMHTWKERAALLEALRSEWEHISPSVLCGLDRENRILLLFPADAGSAEPSPEAVESVKRIARRHTRPLCLGIGRLHPGLEAVPHSYREAVIACRAALNAVPTAPAGGQSAPLVVRWFARLGLERVLFAASPEQEARRLADECLDSLSRYDRERNGQLVRTLRAFLEADGNHAAAAEKLFVHKNTVKYRLQLIRELTGLQPECGRDQLLFRIALTVRSAG